MPWPAHLVSSCNGHRGDREQVLWTLQLYSPRMLSFDSVHDYAAARHSRGRYQCNQFRDHICYRASKPLLSYSLKSSLLSIFLPYSPARTLKIKFGRGSAYLLTLSEYRSCTELALWGRQLSYYTYDKDSGVVEPAALPDNPYVVLDTAPAERWDTNIVLEEGRTKFLAIVEIKRLVRDLWYVLVHSGIRPLPHMPSQRYCDTG
jgi:hypothetical protein